jgi:hypothetical protein
MERNTGSVVTEYLSRFNLVSEVLNTETALDLIAVTELALKEIVESGHELKSQVIRVTDNGRPGDEVEAIQKLCEKDCVVGSHSLTQVSPANHRTRRALSRVVEA